MATESLSAAELVNKCIDWTIQHFSDEVAAVIAAPVFFAVSVSIVMAIVYFYFHWRYADRLETKDDVIRMVTATRDDFKLRWEVAQADLQKLPIPHHDPIAARQIEALKESVTPKLEIEFEDKPGFICWTPMRTGGKACFI